MSSTTVLQQKSASPRQRAPQLTVELSPGLYTAAWVFIVLFHAVCGTPLLWMAMTYWFLTTTIMPHYVSIWSLRGAENYRFYAVVFGIVGAMHGIQVLKIIMVSIRARELALRSERSVVDRVLSSRLGKYAVRSSYSADQPLRVASRVLRKLCRMWSKVFSRRGIFGVESEHFSTVFALQELIAAAAQTYQSYRASNLLPRSELNTIMVALLVANCWTTAGIQVFLRKSPALGRVFTLMYDATINFGMVTVVPLLIFLPYVEAFNVENKTLNNPNFMYDPVSVVLMVLENRVVFAANLFDFTTKLIPQLSILLSLITMSELLGRADVKVIPGDRAPNMQSMEVKTRASFIKAAGLQPSAESSQTPSQSKSLHTLQRWKHGATVTVFVLWGFTVLLLHSLAAQRAANYEVLGCRAVTRPWISNGKEPCASLVYDCHAQNTTSPDQTSFNKLDHDVLSTLSITHCPGLEMPSDFQRLENLVILQIYNTTIANWNASSSISAAVHTRLLGLQVARARMDQVPDGMLQPLPASLMGVQVSHTNLKTLPDDLYQRWHPLVSIAFEHSELSEIPYQMFFSPVHTLSLVGNQIESIPTLAMMPPGMIIPNLQLAANPLKELPAALVEPTAFIVSMNVQNTSLTAMPAWVKTNTKVVWASDTPFCATPMVDPALAYQVICSQLAGQNLAFPIDLFDALYPYET